MSHRVVYFASQLKRLVYRFEFWKKLRAIIVFLYPIENI